MCIGGMVCIVPEFCCLNIVADAASTTSAW